MIIAGVMSGSSLDGLDIAIVQFKSINDWELLSTYAMPYDVEWIARLKNYDKLSAFEYIKLKADFSKYIGQSVKNILDQYSGDVDYVSFHGHTLVHLPGEGITEQIGNGGTIAGIISKPTFTDFRVQDVAKGGVGTPLAPLVELNLFQGHDYYLNLGGIANITKWSNTGKVLAYDVCPCNQILNYYSNLLGHEYDEDGKIARIGTFLPNLVDFFNSISYFKQKAPKSLDNNWILNEVIPNIPIGKPEDILHTYCNWMSTCISNEIDSSETATSLMVSGGGAHNVYFMECLEKELNKKNCTLYLPSKNIIDYKEAILMSLLAYKNIRDESNILCAVTGASSDSIGGAFYKV